MKRIGFSFLFFLAINPTGIFAAVYQSETASLSNAVTETKNAGFTGDSYVNFDNETGSYLELTIGMATAGEQQIAVRFANGTSEIRPMEVKVNGETAAASVDFGPTGAWTIWDTITIQATFKKGINTLRLTSLSPEGGPNIDYFDISGEQSPQYSLNISVTGPGEVLNPAGRLIFFDGQEVRLTALPGLNGKFSGWGGDVSGNEETVAVIMDGNKNITAFFNEIVVEIPEPDFSMVGYASLSGEGYETTTGGKGGQQKYISTLDGLIQWANSREDNETPEIAVISGKIEATETTVISIKHGKNISIFGDPGSGDGYAGLKNISFNIRDYDNVIIRNLKIHEVFYPEDGLTIDECHHVWVDHCEFHSIIGDGITVDTYDGLLDIKKGSHNVTVSWCYLHDHMKTMLIGHSDNNGAEDANLQVTIHHCWFSNTDGRNPSFRFGMCHYFNNYLENITDYGYAARNGAHAKIENCHFQSVVAPIVTDKFDGHGYACVSGCVYTGTCTSASNQISGPFGCEFWEQNLTYPYSLENVNTIAASVKQFAGVGKLPGLLTASQKDFYCESGFSFSVSPNPAFGKIRINISQNQDENVFFSILTLKGELVFSSVAVNLTGKTGTAEIPVYHLKPGIYLIRATSGKSVVCKKIVLF